MKRQPGDEAAAAGGRGIREAVAVFTREATLQAAIDELLQSGFDRAELSLLASEATVRKTLGHRYARVAELEDEAVVPRTAYVAPESLAGAEGGLVGALLYVGATAAAGAVVASGGTLAAAIVAAVAVGGSGGFIGAILASWLDDRHAQEIEHQLNHGGLLLWVRTTDAEREGRAVEILRRHAGRDVHVHALPRAAASPPAA
ncbi:MAG: hypothetical protein RIB84_14825 [Sneathiellaceae bacterium]